MKLDAELAARSSEPLFKLTRGVWTASEPPELILMIALAATVMEPAGSSALKVTAPPVVPLLPGSNVSDLLNTRLAPVPVALTAMVPLWLVPVIENKPVPSPSRVRLPAPCSVSVPPDLLVDT